MALFKAQALLSSSIQKHSDWAPIFDFIQSHKQIQFSERKLDTHDLEVSIQQTKQRQSGKERQRVLHALLLAPGDIASQQLEQRIKRFANLNGGTDHAIFYLVSGPQHVATMMNLQTKLLNKKCDIDVLPIKDPSFLVGFIASFQRYNTASVRGNATNMNETQMQQNQRQLAAVEGTDMTKDLLSCCVEGKFLSKHYADLLAELAPDMETLAKLLITNAGKQRIMDLLGSEEGARVMSFMGQQKITRGD